MQKFAGASFFYCVIITIIMKKYHYYEELQNKQTQYLNNNLVPAVHFMKAINWCDENDFYYVKSISYLKKIADRFLTYTQ